MDRAADAMLNPFTLPFTASMQDYILVLAESIAKQCVLDPAQRNITHDRLLHWAFTSYSLGNEILEVGEMGAWNVESENGDGDEGGFEGTARDSDHSNAADVLGGKTAGCGIGAD